MKPIYLDYSATTPVDKDILKEMTPYFTEKFGNPSSLHSFGQEAVRALDTAREKAAKAIHADFREIIFTGSATEANNLALRGTVRRWIESAKRKAKSEKQQGKAQNNNPPKADTEALRFALYTLRARPKIIVSSIEHESVLETARDLERDGAEVVYLPVDKNGIVNLKKLEESLNERTILVSVMYGNNVTGVIQPIRKIASMIREYKKTSNFQIPRLRRGFGGQANSKFPLFHTDAVQVFQYLDCNVDNLGVDLMTLSSHKIYGPKGVGLLYVRKNSLEPRAYSLEPITTGGGQEFGLRSGTENIPAIVGFAKAMEEAGKIRSQENKRVEKLKNYFWKEIKRAIPNVKRNPDEKTPTLPHILNITIPNAPKNLVALLDAKGVAISSGAACSTRSAKPSYVLTAMGLSEKEAGESIRLSLGKPTTKEEIDEAVRRMKSVLELDR